MYLAEELIQTALIAVTGSAGENLEPRLERAASAGEVDTYFKGCGDENFARAGYDPNVHWCGLFACCMLIRAGARVHWKMGHGIQNDPGFGDVLQVAGSQGIQRGDVAVLPAHGQHHIIVLDRVIPAQGGIACVEGNSKGITERAVAAGRNPRLTPDEIAFYYRVY